MFYSKSVKNELQDSVKCAKNFEVPRKDVFSVRHEPNRDLDLSKDYLS